MQRIHNYISAVALCIVFALCGYIGSEAIKAAHSAGQSSSVPCGAAWWCSMIGGNNAGTAQALNTDGSGNLKVNVAAGGGSGGTSSTFGAAFPATGTAVGQSDGTNMQPFRGDQTNGTFVNLKAMGSTAINSACTAALNSFSQTIPATVCGVWGVYALNAITSVNDNSDSVAVSTPFGTPVVNHPYSWQSQNSVWERQRNQGDIVITPSANFTIAQNTHAYAAGNLIANSTTPGSVTPLSWAAARVNGGSFYIRRARITLSDKSVTGTSFRIHFYSVSPTVTNGDGGAFLSVEANEICTMTSLVSTADPINWTAGSDVSIGYATPSQGNECNGVAAGGSQNVFGLIEARGAYTDGTTVVLTVIPEIHQTN